MSEYASIIEKRQSAIGSERRHHTLIVKMNARSSIDQPMVQLLSCKTNMDRLLSLSVFPIRRKLRQFIYQVTWSHTAETEVCLGKINE